MNAITEKIVPTADANGDEPRTHDARTLIGTECVQARITLDGQVYWLRITRSGKLILTK